MARGEVEADPVADVAQERFACLFRFQNAAFALLPEIGVDAAMSGNQTHHTFGEVGVEIVANDAPLSVWRSFQKAVEKGGEICFGTAIADCFTHFAGDDIEGGNQGLGAVAPVFKFLSLDLPGPHWQRRRQPFQRLDTGHFVDRDRADRIRIRQRAAVDLTNIPAFTIKVGVELRRQPRTQTVRLEIGTFLKCARQYVARSQKPTLGATPDGRDRWRSNG